MVVIREFSDDDFNNETTFDVTRFTTFLQKDNSFLTPWSWEPNTSKNEINTTQEKQYLSFHSESYFSYQIIDEKSGNNAQIINYNQCWLSERLYQQVIWYLVPLIFYNQAPTYFMFPTN
ncbi:hypothetical protein P8452_22258 [Trifolium repens]|nr:hypothetical protein P8452_22258 [Trifolium repens]